jgi:uroporphyrin-III C-methyltransferase/precorrin-2 dehydrogenase/sirohydrochlorin ferrochelatase
MNTPHASYPIHLDLRARRALVVGAGRVATRKIERLVQTAAELHVVALAASAPIRKLAEQARLVLSLRTPREEDLAGCLLVIVATDDDATNAQVASWARAHGVLVSRVDAPQSSDFTVPAFVRGEHVAATVSTFGEAPSASRHLARELAGWALGAPDRFAGEVAAVRRALHGRDDATQRLRALNESGLYEACAAGDEARIRSLVERALAGDQS